MRVAEGNIGKYTAAQARAFKEIVAQYQLVPESIRNKLTVGIYVKNAFTAKDSL